MYGRKVPSSEMCPVTPSYRTRDLPAPIKEDLGCEAGASLPVNSVAFNLGLLLLAADVWAKPFT